MEKAKGRSRKGRGERKKEGGKGGFETATRDKMRRDTEKYVIKRTHDLGA
jgi:hypothetical protein